MCTSPVWRDFWKPQKSHTSLIFWAASRDFRGIRSPPFARSPRVRIKNMSGSLQSPPELGVVTSQRLSVFHEIHRIWQEYRWFLIIFCSFNDFDTRWKARVHLRALNIRDYPSDNLRTCLKMTVWWLFIEQKNIREKFVFRKNIFRGFSTTLMELWAKDSKSSIFVKNHLFLINSRGKFSKKYFFWRKIFSEYFFVL